VLPADQVPGCATLHVPLRRRERSAPQVLVASNPIRSRGGEEHDAQFLQAVADVLAGALDRADAETETRRRALHDPLTGLANRTFLTAHVEQQLAAASRGDGTLSLLLLDVDRFKMVNDTFGHTVGDELLIEVARRLRDVTRRADLVARLGGDEFVVACRHAGPDETAALAERIVVAFEEPFLVRGRELVLGASVGVATAAEGETAAETLLGNADVAMYRAKDQGGDRYVVFDDALRAGVVQRLTLEVALRHALDRGELEVHYQPVITLSDGRLHGFEALLRWNHPEHGDVSPADFIPIAEDTGLIAPIGSWVIDEAFRQLSVWNAQRPGSPLRVGVNMSAAQLTPDLVAEVRMALQRHGVAPQWVVLEITESLLIEGEGANDVLARLRALGVDIALDDFGTGYSSLGYISEYAIDVVKLDRSLIARLGTSTRARGLVRGVVEMAQALGMHVLAEGLENQAQAEAARELGCALGQGWLYSKALPAEEATLVAAESVPSAPTALTTL
jgi:diguanylate cyclase (GGDEF)-like protein